MYVNACWGVCLSNEVSFCPPLICYSCCQVQSHHQLCQQPNHKQAVTPRCLRCLVRKTHCQWHTGWSKQAFPKEAAENCAVTQTSHE